MTGWKLREGDTNEQSGANEPLAVVSLGWRTGRKVGRTVYVQAGREPSDDDVLIGVMDTRELAEHLVACREALRWIAMGRTGSYGSAREFAAAVFGGSW